MVGASVGGAKVHLLIVGACPGLKGGLDGVAQHALQVVHPGHHAPAEVHPDAAVLPPGAEVTPEGLIHLPRHS